MSISNDIQQIVTELVGNYSPNETQVYLPIESFDPTTGAVYISNYIEHDIVASGIASLDINYVVTVALVFIIGYLIIGSIANSIKFAVAPRSKNKL